MGGGSRAVGDVEKAVERSIEEMHEKLAEALSIGDMAKSAMCSKFHFSREFQRVTGVTPRRFLSALRLQKAKELLLATQLTVAEISQTVGYGSVGTFSSRFAISVGVSPSDYRRQNGFIDPPGIVSNGEIGGAVKGVVTGPPDADLGLIFLGLFPGRVPEGEPVSCTILRRPGPFEIGNTPPGSWYLLGHSVPAAANEALTDWQEVHVGHLGPLEVPSGASSQTVEFQLRSMRILDPPVLPALQNIRSAAFAGGLLPADH
ncbi:AraC family transcriptional regulator [Streptomyces klenkii]|uniref:AraC family transcriptional regulator n=1 Tax=Streptomyces klenkii TaxID=1420899 RepID=UPI00339F3751